MGTRKPSPGQQMIPALSSPGAGQDDGDEGQQRRGIAIAAITKIERNRIGYKVGPAVSAITALPTLVRRPVVNLREGPAHECGTLRIRELVHDPERINALLVAQQSHCARPVGAP